MSDSYQAIYDATRSRINNGDVGSAIESAMRDANLSHYVSMACDRIAEAAAAYDRPSAIYRPVLSKDGNAWIALYGSNLQEGVSGHGDTPAAAMSAFDVAWHREAGNFPS